MEDLTNLAVFNGLTLKMWQNKVFPKLSQADKNSLSNTVIQFTNLGNEFPNYRETRLRGVPNSVLFEVLKFLKKQGNFPILVTREMGRYNLILTFGVQQYWTNILEPLFRNITFISLKKVQKTKNIHEEKPEIFFDQIMNSIETKSTDEIIDKIVSYEEEMLSYIVLINTETVKAIMTFRKSPLNKLNVIYSKVNGIFSYTNNENNSKVGLSNDESGEETTFSHRNTQEHNISMTSFQETTQKQRLSFPLLSMDVNGPFVDINGSKRYF